LVKILTDAASRTVRAARGVVADVRSAARAVRGPRDWIALALFLAFVTGASVATGWLARYAVRINGLTRGVGDLVFYGGDGKPWFRMDERRRDVTLDRISPYLRQAVVATEDRRFRWHHGFDPIGFTRAMVRNLREGEMVEGASTITQQLARTLYLSTARNVGRKAKEAAIAYLLEARLDKDQILELYLNRVYLSAGIYGVEAMSTSVFGKHASDLTIGEAALIAGLIQAPSAFSPWTNLDAARRRSEVVLSRMVTEGYITEAQARQARRERLRVRQHPGASDARAGYAKEYLRQQFRVRFGGDYPADWQVRTTILPAVQDAAERAVADGLRRLGGQDLQAALVALDPQSGDLLAIVGGRDFRQTPFNRAWRTHRQPGSAFKPILYAAALSHGFSPISTVSGLASLAPQGPEEWTPRNARDDGDDTLTLRDALAESNNRAAVVLQQRVGTRAVLRAASDLGVRDQPDVPSLALGSGLVSPLDLTAAYAAFPNGGFAVRPRAILRVIDEDGGVVLDEAVRRERALSPQVAYQLVSMMREVVDRGTASGVRAWGVRFPVGAKTGTTNDFKDAWFVGYSSAVVVGVWVGYDQPATIGRDAFGSRVALPIWADFMRRTSRVLKPAEFAMPDGLRDEELCRLSHLRPVEDCPTYVEYFKKGDDVPGRLCSMHHGTLKERARRAVEGLVTGLIGKLLGMLK
jgi:penicillin-binding protein 1A